MADWANSYNVECSDKNGKNVKIGTQRKEQCIDQSTQSSEMYCIK